MSSISIDLNNVALRGKTLPVQCFLDQSNFNIPNEVISSQIPLSGETLRGNEFDTVGKLQESVGKLIISRQSGEIVGSGSAIAISPNGLFLSVAHAVNSQTYTLSDILSYMNGVPNEKSFKVQLPILNKETGTATFRTLDLVLVDFNSHLDAAVFALKNPEQDPLTFLSLRQEVAKIGDTSYKLGHLLQSNLNQLSKGLTIHTARQSNSLCSECSEVKTIITTIPCAYGDSGGAFINENGELIGLIRAVSYFDLPLDESDIAAFAGNDEIVNELKDTRIISQGPNIQLSVLPYLERVVGSQFNNLLDGKEVNVYPKEAQGTVNNPPAIIIFSFVSRETF